MIRIALSLVYCVMFCRTLFSLFFIFAIVLSVLQSMAFHYPFGIFKLFIHIPDIQIIFQIYSSYSRYTDHIPDIQFIFQIYSSYSRYTVHIPDIQFIFQIYSSSSRYTVHISDIQLIFQMVKLKIWKSGKIEYV